MIFLDPSQSPTSSDLYTSRQIYQGIYYMGLRAAVLRTTHQTADDFFFGTAPELLRRDHIKAYDRDSRECYN